MNLWNLTPKPSKRSCLIKIAALCAGSLIYDGAQAQEGSVAIEPPRFRVRTDANAASDAQALREQLRYLVDSQGPINPLSDYGKRSLPSLADTARKPNPDKPGTDKPSFRLQAAQDPEASQAPSLDKESARRLQASGLTLPSSTLGVVGLLPPPEIRGASPLGSGSLLSAYDDGFRPVSPGSTSLSAFPSSVVVPASAPLGNGLYDGSVRTANFIQDDPIANIPPTLNSPPVISGGTLPGGGALPGSIPAIPQPAPQLPPPSIPSGIPSTGPAGLPSYPQTVAPGSPVAGSPVAGPAIGNPTNMGQTIPPPTMPSNSVPTTVLPAPPTYYVPAPNVAQGPAGSVMQTGVPYAGSPMPTYNRAGTFVNSAPFVSAPPAAVDARWMVSPAVWQQASNASNPACPPNLAGTPSLASATAPGAPKPGVPGAPVAGVPIGVNGVAPTTGLVPSASASPFAYAPPAAMPPQTIYAPANGGFVPVVGFGQAPNAQLGRGMYGQPTAYVDGQPIRNFLRYIFP